MAETYGKLTGISRAKCYYLLGLLCKAVLSRCNNLNEKKEEGKKEKFALGFVGVLSYVKALRGKLPGKE